MGIKDFFRKVGNGIRKAGRFIRDKVLPTVGRIAKPVLGVVGALPGVAGIVGRIGSGIASVLHGATQKIPNEDARRRIDDVISQGHERFQGAVDRGRGIAEDVNRRIGVARDIVKDIKDNPATRDVIDHFKKLPVDLASKVKLK